MKNTIASTGFVRLSKGILLAQYNEVKCLDVAPEKVAKLNRKESPIADAEIEEFLQNRTLNLRETQDKRKNYIDADNDIISTPTDYDPETNYLNTKSIEAVIRDVMDINTQAVMVIKSTNPVGYTNRKREELETKNLIFSTEFLREGLALHDNPHHIMANQINA